MEIDKSLGQIERDLNYNFSKKYDEDNDVFSHNLQACRYLEIDQFKNNFSTRIDNFSTYSHNVRSLNGHWDDIMLNRLNFPS